MMNVYKRLVSVFVLALVLVHVQCFPVLSKGSDKSQLLLEGANSIQNNFVGPADVETLVNGAKKALLREIQEDPILRTKPSLKSDLTKTTDISSLQKVYRECVRILDGEDGGSHLIYAMMRGMADSLYDPHTRFFSLDEAKKFFGGLQETVIKGGIGITFVISETGFFEIVEVIDDTPASSAGLLSGDLIVEVDEMSTKGMSLEKVTGLIRGEAESFVRLTILRKGSGVFDVTLVRKPIHVGSVKSSVMNNVGYIKLRYFGEDTNKNLDACFVKFDAANVKAYVLDMRGNGGGYVNVAVHTVSKFLPKGRIVVSFAGRMRPTQIYTTNGLRARDLPVVVLIDKGSASASEMVAGALQDNGCKIVGVKSYGKGSMQDIDWLSDGSMLKITIAHWFTPLHRPVDGVGITPDIVVTQDENSKEDTQLKRALEEAGR